MRSSTPTRWSSAAWRLESAALIAAFHERATSSAEQQRVEAAIVELASEYLLASLVSARHGMRSMCGIPFTSGSARLP